MRASIWKIQISIPFLAGLIAGLIYFCLPVLGGDFAYIPGDLGDARFNNYLLEHAWLWMKGDISGYWNADFMYPEPAVITYSDNLLGTSPFYAVFRAAGLSREHAFQVWFVLLCAFNYCSAFLLLRHLTGSGVAAMAGAMVFAWSIALHSQVGHAQTFARFPMPLAFYFACRYSQSLLLRHFLFSLLALVYQVWCGLYLGLLLIAPLALFYFWMVLCDRKRHLGRFRSRQWWLGVTGSCALSALLLIPLLLPYLRRAGEMGFHHYQDVVTSVPAVVSRIFSWRGSFVWNFLDFTYMDLPAYWDHLIFPGAVAILSALVLLLWMVAAAYRKNASRYGLFFPFTLAMVFTWILFTRFGTFSFYNVLYNLIPGYPSMRCITRIINVELIFYGVSAAFVVSRIPAGRPWLIGAMLVLLLAADHFVRPQFTHRVSVSDARGRVERLTEKIGDNTQLILSYEPDTITDKPIYSHIDAMLAAQQLGMRTINGYSSTSPKGYGDYWHSPDPVSRRKWISAWRISPDSVLVVK